MCGIVGVHLRNDALAPRLGEMLASMLDALTSRGPDSAGIALYNDDLPPGQHRFSMRSAQPIDWERLGADLAARLGAAVEVRPEGRNAVVVTEAGRDDVLTSLSALGAGVNVVGHGRAIEVYKDVGSPRDICERYRIGQRSGYQGVGHTRMATESAVTTEHSHPFAPGDDLALVHNGTFSNYATVRRRLMAEGVRFDTDNDSEVAARHIAWHMGEGLALKEALQVVLKELDGFYTLLVATRDEFAVLRDPFACKPAVVAETTDYVAMASEYQALAGLPGIGDAEVFEPAPEEIYLWSR
jgi:glutamate synthase domain-containing protein 1